MFRSGFTTVTDIDFGPDGSLYVIEHSTGSAFFVLPGDLVKITTDGQRTVLVSNLNRPTSVLVGSDGTVYYTNKGITAGIGRSVEADALDHHEPRRHGDFQSRFVRTTEKAPRHRPPTRLRWAGRRQLGRRSRRRRRRLGVPWT